MPARPLERHPRKGETRITILAAPGWQWQELLSHIRIPSQESPCFLSLALCRATERCHEKKSKSFHPVEVFFTWKDWPWLPPSAISREGEELIRPSGGTPCRSPQTRDPLKMCFILNHSINYGVTFSSGFPSLEMKLFTYCKTSSWCFGKSLDKNQLYTKSEQFFLHNTWKNESRQL